MSQWKLVANGTVMIASNSTSTSNTSGPPLWGAMILRQGSGHTAMVANSKSLVQNTTPNSIVTAGVGQNKLAGIFPQTPAAYANGLGENTKVTAGPGWLLRTAYEGPIRTIT